jgi:hypothetical protein
LTPAEADYATYWDKETASFMETPDAESVFHILGLLVESPYGMATSTR